MKHSAKFTDIHNFNLHNFLFKSITHALKKALLKNHEYIQIHPNTSNNDAHL